MVNQENILNLLYHAMIERAQAPAALANIALPASASGRTVIVGAGKAAAAMARVLRASIDGPVEGTVITRYGYGCSVPGLTVVEAAHPIPDTHGETAARTILQTAEALTEDDRLIVVMSGGASALLALPAPGLSLADKQAVTRALLASGASIGAINTVRKHLSAIKGGRLATAAYPAPTLTLAISDVVGDDPSVIGSGPTVADPTTLDDTRAILERTAIPLPEAVARYLDSDPEETPKSGDERLSRSDYRIVARPADGLAAAADKARSLGLAVTDLGDAVEGEAHVVAQAHATQALDIQRTATKPTLLLSGGELTVTLRGNGKGGPNTEYALALALALNGAPGIHALAADTDGIDGVMDNAGAVIGPNTLARGTALGLDARVYLENNDSYGYFAATGDLVVTGPTMTNVNDFRGILINPAP